MSRYIYHLYTATSRRLRRFFPPPSVILAHPMRVRYLTPRLVFVPCYFTPERDWAIPCEGYTGLDDVYVFPPLMFETRFYWFVVLFYFLLSHPFPCIAPTWFIEYVCFFSSVLRIFLLPRFAHTRLTWKQSQPCVPWVCDHDRDDGNDWPFIHSSDDGM